MNQSLYSLLPKPSLQIWKGSDREFRIFLKSMDADPHRSESDICFREIISEIEKIFLGPKRRDIDDILDYLRRGLLGCREKRFLSCISWYVGWLDLW